MTQAEIDRIKDFFFEAMLVGWASYHCRLKSTIPELPGSRVIIYRRDDLSLVDCYFVTEGSKVSHGIKTIDIYNKPVWVMHYGGWYEKAMIPFLKRTLMVNYNQKVFLGGRGPSSLEGEDHTVQYLNRLEQSSFNKFKGFEWIESTTDLSGFPAGQVLGEHNYFGGLLD